MLYTCAMGLKELAEKVADAGRQLDDLTRMRDEAIREALRAGTGPTELARIFGLSRGRIHQIRDHRR